MINLSNAPKINVKSIKEEYRADKIKPIGWNKTQLRDLLELVSGDDAVSISWIINKQVFGNKTKGTIGKALSNIRNGVIGWETK